MAMPKVARDAQHQVGVADPAELVVDGLLVVERAVEPGEQVVDAVARLLRVRRTERDGRRS